MQDPQSTMTREQKLALDLKLHEARNAFSRVISALEILIMLHPALTEKLTKLKNEVSEMTQVLEETLRAEKSEKSNAIQKMNEVLGFLEKVEKEVPAMVIDEPDVCDEWKVWRLTLSLFIKITKAVVAGKPVIEIFNPTDIISAIISTYKRDAEERGLYLRFGSTGLMEKVEGNVTGFLQVLINLLTNALKFTKSGGVTILASQRDAETEILTLNIKVKDTGLGMESGKMAKLFHARYQVREEDKVKGTGLGLNETKKIVEEMGGNIGVFSTSGEGTVFEFNVNVKKVVLESKRVLVVEKQDSEGPEIKKRRAQEEQGKKRLRLLVVEDEMINIACLRQQLKTDYDCVYVKTGEEAVALFKREHFDGAIVDRHLSPLQENMSGIQVVNQIRDYETEVLNRTPEEQIVIIGRTGDPDFGSLRITRRAGKAVDRFTIVEHIKKAFAGEKDSLPVSSVIGQTLHGSPNREGKRRHSSDPERSPSPSKK